MNRDVYAVPGPIHSPKSEACNALIRNGLAKLVTDGSHISEEYSYLDVRPAQRDGATGASLSPEEDAIYQLLLITPSTADELHEATGMAFGHLHAVLINLSLKHKIEQQSGSIYMAL